MKHVLVWRPYSRHFSTRALMVPLYGPDADMSQSRYRDLLLRRLRELIEQNPRAAKDAMDTSPEYSPDLYQIGLMCEPKQYPDQIMLSDQMMIRLNQIDWSRKGRILRIPEEELPSLEELIETL